MFKCFVLSQGQEADSLPFIIASPQNYSVKLCRSENEELVVHKVPFVCAAFNSHQIQWIINGVTEYHHGYNENNGRTNSTYIYTATCDSLSETTVQCQARGDNAEVRSSVAIILVNSELNFSLDIIIVYYCVIWSVQF